MKFAGLLFVIGSLLILVCLRANGENLRKHRQFDFVFPDDFDGPPSYGGLGIQNDYPNAFFPNKRPQGQPQQFQQPQGQTQQQRPPLRRVPFPTPILPGPPANIDSFVRATTVVPDMMTTTPSPSFHACMANCPTTSEYNPICGTNYQLYFNQQKFDCALRCGAQVRVWRRGSCAGLFNMVQG